MSELDFLTGEEMETFSRSCRVALTMNQLYFGRSACYYYCAVNWRQPFGLFVSKHPEWTIVEYQ